MATWADEISQLTTGGFPNDSCEFFIMAKHRPQLQSKKLLYYDWLLWENFGSRHVHLFNSAHWTKKLSPTVAVGHAI